MPMGLLRVIDPAAVQVMQVRSRKAEQPLYFAVKIMKIKSVIQACTRQSYWYHTTYTRRIRRC